MSNISSHHSPIFLVSIFFYFLLHQTHLLNLFWKNPTWYQSLFSSKNSSFACRSSSSMQPWSDKMQQNWRGASPIKGWTFNLERLIFLYEKTSVPNRKQSWTWKLSWWRKDYSSRVHSQCIQWACQEWDWVTYNQQDSDLASWFPPVVSSDIL